MATGMFGQNWKACRTGGALVSIGVSLVHVLTLLLTPDYTRSEDKKVGSDGKTSRLIFLGTGSSTGCPRPLCPLLFQSQDTSPSLKAQRDFLAPYCIVSNLASRGSPKDNPNYRNNPSLLISVVSEADSDADVSHTTTKNVIIDVGKTFREGALRWMPSHGISSVDAIILTHQHMDAAAGLDDVRGFQKWQLPRGNLSTSQTASRPTAIPMPLHVSQICLDDLRERFPWLLPHHKNKRGEIKASVDDKKPIVPVVERHVASFDVHIFEPFRRFKPIEGLEIIPLPVMHGEDLVSYGFAFTVGNTNCVYLSDISRMLDETLDYILKSLPPTDILVVDALHPQRENAVHFNMEEALRLVEKIRPREMTYLVGMNCDSFLPHEEMNQQLRRKYGNVQLAHDGLVIAASK